MEAETGTLCSAAPLSLLGNALRAPRLIVGRGLAPLFWRNTDGNLYGWQQKDKLLGVR